MNYLKIILFIIIPLISTYWISSTLYRSIYPGIVIVHADISAAESRTIHLCTGISQLDINFRKFWDNLSTILNKLVVTDNKTIIAMAESKKGALPIVRDPHSSISQELCPPSKANIILSRISIGDYIRWLAVSEVPLRNWSIEPSIKAIGIDEYNKTILLNIKAKILQPIMFGAIPFTLILYGVTAALITATRSFISMNNYFSDSGKRLQLLRLLYNIIVAPAYIGFSIAQVLALLALMVIDVTVFVTIESLLILVETIIISFIILILISYLWIRDVLSTFLTALIIAAIAAIIILIILVYEVVVLTHISRILAQLFISNPIRSWIIIAIPLVPIALDIIYKRKRANIINNSVEARLSPLIIYYIITTIYFLLVEILLGPTLNLKIDETNVLPYSILPIVLTAIVISYDNRWPPPFRENIVKNYYIPVIVASLILVTPLLLSTHPRIFKILKITMKWGLNALSISLFYLYPRMLVDALTDTVLK